MFHPPADGAAQLDHHKSGRGLFPIRRFLADQLDTGADKIVELLGTFHLLLGKSLNLLNQRIKRHRRLGKVALQLTAGGEDFRIGNNPAQLIDLIAQSGMFLTVQDIVAGFFITILPH